MFGTIVFFKSEKGFGFIRLSSGDDVFFHVSDLPPGAKPRIGLSVEFRIGTRRGRQIAMDIKPMGDACAILGSVDVATPEAHAIGSGGAR